MKAHRVIKSVTCGTLPALINAMIPKTNFTCWTCVVIDRFATIGRLCPWLSEYRIAHNVWQFISNYIGWNVRGFYSKYII